MVRLRVTWTRKRWDRWDWLLVGTVVLVVLLAAVYWWPVRSTAVVTSVPDGCVTLEEGRRIVLECTGLVPMATPIP
jgi:hypothetical protein